MWETGDTMDSWKLEYWIIFDICFTNFAYFTNFVSETRLSIMSQ